MKESNFLKNKKIIIEGKGVKKNTKSFKKLDVLAEELLGMYIEKMKGYCKENKKVIFNENDFETLFN